MVATGLWHRQSYARLSGGHWSAITTIGALGSKAGKCLKGYCPSMWRWRSKEGIRHMLLWMRMCDGGIVFKMIIIEGVWKIYLLIGPWLIWMIFLHVIFKHILVIDGSRICCESAPIWMSLDFTDDQSTLVQVMAWCRQATSHNLSQCWHRSLLSYGVIRPQWVKYVVSIVAVV